MPWSQPIRAQYLEGSGPIRGLHSHPRATCTVSLLATAQSGWPRQAPALSASTATSTPSSRWSASGRWRLGWRRPDCRPSCSSSLWVTAPLMLVSRDSSTSPSFRSPWNRGSAPGLTFTSSPGRRMRWESDISGAAVASNLIISGQFTPHTSHLPTPSFWNLKYLAFHLYLTPFQISYLKSHTSNLIPQISYLKSHTSNLTPETSDLPPLTCCAQGCGGGAEQWARPAACWEWEAPGLGWGAGAPHQALGESSGRPGVLGEDETCGGEAFLCSHVQPG